jgi:hypothetical protein
MREEIATGKANALMMKEIGAPPTRQFATMMLAIVRLFRQRFTRLFRRTRPMESEI